MKNRITSRSTLSFLAITASILLTNCGKKGSSDGDEGSAVKPSGATVQAVSCGAMSTEACQVFTLTNEERVKNGLPAFSYCARCAGMAYEHTVDVAQRGYFGHYRHATEDRPAETFQTRFARFKIPGFGGGENLAQAYSPQQAVDMWMASTGHKANILNASFVSMGVGYFNGYYVQVFSTSATSTAELPQIHISGSMGGPPKWNFKYSNDSLFMKITGAQSTATGCIEAYIPSRAQNNSECRSTDNWLSVNSLATLASNPDWAPFNSVDSTFEFGATQPAMRVLKNHPYLPNAFGRYKVYVKNSQNEPASIMMFEINP